MNLFEATGFTLIVVLIAFTIVFFVERYEKNKKFIYVVGQRIYPYATVKEITKDGMKIIIENGGVEIFLRDHYDETRKVTKEEEIKMSNKLNEDGLEKKIAKAAMKWYQNDKSDSTHHIQTACKDLLSFRNKSKKTYELPSLQQFL